MRVVGGARPRGPVEYNGVQALRAIAALAVVAGHSTDYLRGQNGVVPAALAWVHGPAGVDIFFVISGFVMMLSSGRLLEKAHPARLFLWRRALRIVPLYWVVTALKLLLITISPALSVRGRPSAWNMVASFLFIPSLNPEGEIRPLITPGWTLNFETMFYLLFALALVFGKGRGTGEQRRGLVRFLAPMIMALAVCGVLRTGSWPVWTAWADPIVLEFLAGVGIAWLTIRQKLPGEWVSLGMIAAGVVGLVLMSPGDTWLTTRPLVWGVPAALIVLGTVSLEGRVGRRLPGWLLLLGSASYSIYLMQSFVFPPIHFAMERLSGGMVHRSPVEAGLLMMLLSLLLATAVGLATYLLVERKMTEFFKSRLGVERIAPVAR